MNAGIHARRGAVCQRRLGCIVSGELMAVNTIERMVVEQMGDKGIKPSIARKRLTREAKLHFAGACEAGAMAQWLISKMGSGSNG